MKHIKPMDAYFFGEIIGVVVLAILLSSCTAQMERMGRGREGGDTYSYNLFQLGGQGAFESSSGTRAVVNNETSFKDAMQAVATTAATFNYAKAALATEVTKRHAAGQLTQQQANQLNFEIAKIHSDADVAKFMAALEAQP